MKINSYKIKLAQKFLNKLKKEIVKINTDESLVLDMYANGREAGYHLRCSNGFKDPFLMWACSFSESRNSDQLVVYIGKIMDFDMAGNIPNELTYKNKKFYSEGELKKAIAGVVESLRAFLLVGEKAVEHAKV